MLSAAALTLRVTLGTFFIISGYHKIFNPVRRKTLEETFRADNCYSPLTMWVIPLGEAFGGLGILTGTLTTIAAAGVLLICVGACSLDGFKRIKTWGPLDRADYLDDVLYLPEVLYATMLVVLILIGPGAYSGDAIIGRLWA